MVRLYAPAASQLAGISGGLPVHCMRPEPPVAAAAMSRGCDMAPQQISIARGNACEWPAQRNACTRLPVVGVAGHEGPRETLTPRSVSDAAGIGHHTYREIIYNISILLDHKLPIVNGRPGRGPGDLSKASDSVTRTRIEFYTLCYLSWR